MQAFNAIQNATINTIAGFQAGLVVDVANVHRSYLRPERSCEVRPVSKHPEVRVSSQFQLDGTGDLKQGRLLMDAAQGDCGTRSRTTPTGRTWRIDNRHLPASAWAMLVLSRSMCG